MQIHGLMPVLPVTGLLTVPTNAQWDALEAQIAEALQAAAQAGVPFAEKDLAAHEIAAAGTEPTAAEALEWQPILPEHLCCWTLGALDAIASDAPEDSTQQYHRWVDIDVTSPGPANK